MMTAKDRKGPKKSRQPLILQEPMSKPKRLHIYKPEDVRGNITGAFIRWTLGFGNNFLGLEINKRFIGISLIFRHIVFSFKPQ